MLKRNVIALSTSFLLLTSSLIPSPIYAETSAATTSVSSATVVQENWVTRGALLQEWKWTPPRGNVKMNVIKVDLHDPYIKIDTMAGTGGKLGTRQTVSQMAKETGAVAATNGDYFVMSYPEAPLGPQVMDGEWISSPGFVSNFYAFGIKKDRQLVFSPFTFSGSVTAQNGTSFPLSGLNKSIYYPTTSQYTHSHADQLHLYTDKWGLGQRGIGDGLITPTEVLIQDGEVIDIRVGGQVVDIIPEGMQVLVGHGKAATFLQENIQIGDKIEIDYTMSPEGEYQMVIGGYPPLLLDGKATGIIPNDLKGANARTAIGASKDGRYLYLVAVERATNGSTGMTLQELAEFMLYIGAWNAINLDGGGSTAMVARPLGKYDHKLLNLPKDGSQRKVPNGIAIYSTAPEGALQGLIIEGETFLFKNESVTYNIFAYDEFYNPVDPKTRVLQWSLSNAIGTVDPTTYTLTALAEGKTDLIVSGENASKSISIEVVGRKQIDSFKTANRALFLKPGETKSLQIRVKNKEGKTRVIPNHLVTWTVDPEVGTIDANGNLVASMNPGEGLIIASYDGFRTVLPVHVGKEVYLQTLESDVGANFAANIPEVTGSFGLVANNDFYDGKMVAKLTYDFTKGKGLKVAYGQFGDKGLNIPGEPTRMKLWVYGDKSDQWLRAEIHDAAYKAHYITLSPKVDWTGWREVQVELPKDLTYPIKLRRIYVADLEQGTENRAKQGTILFDNIQFDQAKKFTPIETKVVVTLNQKTMLVNGQKIELEQAPILINDRTMVPVRAITEAFGGEVLWDETEQKVTLIRGETLIDLWINDKDTLIVNGKAMTSDVAPTIKNNRTLLPLRFLAENLGLTVEWNEKTREVTIY